MSSIESSTTESGVNSTAYLNIERVKCNNPRARFDVIFYPHYIQLIQFNSNKDVIISHSINKSDVKEMYRLPADKQQMFIVLHLSHSIIGRIRMSYDFIVFTFLKNEYIETKLDSTDSPIINLFRREIDGDGVISGKTMHIFEKMLKYVLDKPAIVPAYQNISTSVIKCTFADDIDHYLYPLRDRFVSVWRHCQCLNLTEIMYVKFVKREGRAKTFDFTIYPSLNNIDNKISKSVKCWYFEFKFIDQKHYDWLYEYCTNNGIQHKCDSDETSGTDSDSDSGDDNTGNLRDIIAGVDYEPPDPHMSRCHLEGKSVDSSNNEEEIDRNIAHLRNINTATNQSRCKKVKYRHGSESTTDKDAGDQASPNTDSSSDYSSGERSDANLRKTIVDVNYEVPDSYLSRCKREGKYRSSLESTNEQESDSSSNYNPGENKNVNLRKAIADVNYKVPDPYLSRCKREGKYRSSLESTNEHESDSSSNHNSSNLRKAIADVNYEVPDPYLSRCKREGKYRSSLESTDEEADNEVSQHSDCSSDLSKTIVDVKYEAPDPYLLRCKREGKYRTSFEYASEQESDSSSNDNSGEKSNVNLSKTIVDVNYEVPDPYLSRCKREGKYRNNSESRKKGKTAKEDCSFSGPNSVVKLRCRKRVIFDEENVDDRSICDSFVKKEKK